MPRPLAPGQRRKVVGLRQEGHSITAIARAMGIARKTVRSVMAVHQKTSRVDPSKSRCRPLVPRDSQDCLLFNMCESARVLTAGSCEPSGGQYWTGVLVGRSSTAHSFVWVILPEDSPVKDTDSEKQGCMADTFLEAP